MALQCSRNRKLYRCIWLFSLLVTLIACALLFYAIYSYRENGCAEREKCNWLPFMKTAKLRQENCRPACTTKDCLLAANFILENMDETVDPCEDFYAYSCNGWAKRYSKNEDSAMLEDLATQLQIEMKDVLESIKSPPETVAGKLRTFYDSCMDKNASQLASKASVLKFLKKIGIPDWPHLSSDFTFTKMEETLAMMAAYQQFSFVEFSFIRPSGNYSDADYIPLVVPHEILNISVSCKRPFIWEGDMEEAQVLVTEMLTYLGLDEDSVNETWCDFMEFDQRMLNITYISDDVNYNCSVNETLCDETKYFLDCSKEVPNEIVSLCKMIEHFLTFLRIGDRYTTTSIIVEDAYFVNRIFPYIANHTQRLVANYLAVRVVLENLQHMGHRFGYLYEKHRSVLVMRSASSPFKAERWLYCVNIVSTDFTNLLALEYIAKKLPEVARKEIHDVFEIIKEGLANVTATADWIGEDMREQLTELIKSVSHNFENFIDIAVNKTEIEAAYKEYHPTKESFLLNVLEHEKIRNRRKLLHLSSWQIRKFFRPFMVNARYIPDRRQIDLLFGVLLPPIYMYGRSKSENLAVLGPLIGHEIGHAVGNFFKILKMEDVDEQTRDSYLARKGCLTDQYGDFEIQNIGQKVNSSITFQDDLADHLGVAMAIRAHRRHVERKQDEVHAMPGLDLTPEQIFFLSYAQMWCAVFSKKTAMQLREIDVHSPPEFRVTGVVQNMQEFAEAFKCPRGSPMNPENKCSFLPQPSN